MARASTSDVSPRQLVHSPRTIHLVLLAAVCVAVACGPRTKARPEMPPPDVAVARVVEKEIEDVHDFTGRVEATNTVELHPRVSGTVTSVKFKEGSHVKAGQLLCEID